MTTQEAMLETASAIRGKILQLVIEMETRMDIYIAQYFTSDIEKQTEFTILVLGNIGLQAKRTLLEYLLHQDPSNLKKDIKMVIGCIDNITSKRNSFAHWPVDLSKQAEDIFIKDKKLSFVKMQLTKLRKKIELGAQHDWPEEGINGFIKHINAVNEVLSKLDMAHPLKFSPTGGT